MRSIASALLTVLACIALSACSGSSASNPVSPVADTAPVDLTALATPADLDEGALSTQTDTGGPWPRCYTIIKGHYKCTQCHYRGGSSHTTCVPYTRP